MKTLITLLFFTSTLALIVLTFLLLKYFDSGEGGSTLVFLLIAFCSCIFLLGYLLFRYINLPADKNDRSLFKEDAD